MEGTGSNSETLPEVVRLGDARPGRPENAVGAAGFWHEPEVWSLPLSPAARVLYAGLCSHLGTGEIDRRDLRGALRDSSDKEIAGSFDELARHGLLAPAPKGYEIRSVKEFKN